MENMDNKDLKKKSELGVSSLVLGIISIVFAVLWYISLPCGVLAIIFGKKAINRVGSKLGKAGLILGIIGLVIFGLIYLSFIGIIIVANF